MGYKQKQWQLGPNPDPTRFKDIKTPDGWYRKRITYGALNEVMTAYKDATKVTMPAATRILDKLQPWTQGVELVRLGAKIGGKLKKVYMENGKMTFEHMKDLEMQPRRKFKGLFIRALGVRIGNNDITVNTYIFQRIISEKEKIYTSDLRLPKSIYSEFFFELIMLWGDPMRENGLKVDSVESKIYKRYAEYDEQCVLKIDLPKNEPWMAIVKLTCLEEGEMPIHPRHYGMKVVAVG